MALDDTRVTPAHTKFDGAELLSDEPLGAVRPSFRGDHRRRPADRPGAGGPVRLRARVDLARRRRLPRRRGPRLHRALGVDAARRPLAGRHRPHRDRSASPATTAAIAILFIVVIALAGLGLAVVNALAESAWGTFTIGATIPLAMFMGFYMFKWRKGKIKEATIIGVVA